MEFPESIDPDSEQKLAEKLSMDPTDYEYLEFIRRHMKYIVAEENKKQDPDNDKQ